MSKENKYKGLFRTDALGFCKKDVFAHLETLETAAAEQDAFVKALVEDNAELRAKIAEFEERERAMEEERELISQTMVDARESAAKMIKTARADAARQCEELQLSCEIETDRLATIREELAQLRKFAADTVRAFEAELKELENESPLEPMVE